MRFYEVATDQVTVREPTSGIPRPLSETSDVSTSLPENLVGYPDYRTRPAPCTR
ncbi:hypothetical protein GCM10022384_69700 [Streptomyces marokkonensis]|uniref:Uncharacterized protein n=1 Tax=Streptomyces marokkonensis TaxID=324855 RepID=A0ABP7SUT7_9ACTN